MNLESPKTRVQKSAEDLYRLLTDVANYEKLLPDSLESFETGEDSFKFSLKGMPAIRLAFEEKTPYEYIRLKATADNLPVFLSCKIESIGLQEVNAQLFIDADINPMMAMMLKKPLQKLLDTLANKMDEL